MSENFSLIASIEVKYNNENNHKSRAYKNVSA